MDRFLLCLTPGPLSERQHRDVTQFIRDFCFSVPRDFSFLVHIVFAGAGDVCAPPRRKQLLCRGATAPPSGQNTNILLFCLGLTFKCPDEYYKSRRARRHADMIQSVKLDSLIRSDLVACSGEPETPASSQPLGVFWGQMFVVFCAVVFTGFSSLSGLRCQLREIFQHSRS